MRVGAQVQTVPRTLTIRAARVCSAERLGWPLSYRVVTVPANLEGARYQDRHGAIIQRHQNMQWLDGLVLDAELLTTPRKRSFVVEELSGGRRQAVLAL